LFLFPFEPTDVNNRVAELKQQMIQVNARKVSDQNQVSKIILKRKSFGLV